MQIFFAKRKKMHFQFGTKILYFATFATLWTELVNSIKIFEITTLKFSKIQNFNQKIQTGELKMSYLGIFVMAFEKNHCNS